MKRKFVYGGFTALAAVILTSAGLISGVGAADSPNTDSCVRTINDDGSQSINCPALPTATVTVTVPGPTTTVTVSSSATPTPTPTITPTPTPTPSPTITSPSTGCVAKPSACGFPDATNTGIPAGTVLKRVPQDVSSGPGWHYDTRGWIEIDGAGAVFKGYSVGTNVDVTADNVTIDSIRLIESGESFGVSIRHAKNTLISNSYIGGPSPAGASDRLMVGVKNIYGDELNTRVIGCEIVDTGTGIQIDSGLIQDNYIHNMGFKTGDHINGTTSNGGGPQLTIRHNTIFNQISQTDAVSLFEDFGSQHDRLITNNLLAGGGYTIYGGANPGGQKTSNIVISNNRIGRQLFPKGGFYGWLTAVDAGATVTGNVWDDNGALIN